MISTTPTAQGPLAAGKPVPHAPQILGSAADAANGAGAAAALLGTSAIVARGKASPSRAVHRSRSAPTQRHLSPARDRRVQKTAPLAPPKPALLRNPYGMQSPRLGDAPHSSGNTCFRARQHGLTTSSHADVEALLSRQDAALYDACVSRLRVVRRERRALAEKMEASKQQLERVHALLATLQEKPPPPPATTLARQAERDGEVPKPQPGNSSRQQETQRMMRQLRELDTANDVLRERYEALQQEKRQFLTVHSARLRRPAPVAAPSSAASPRSSGAAACEESKASELSAAFTSVLQTLDTRLATVMAQQQALQQELALAMSRERGRIKALTDLHARGFARGHAPEPSSSATT
ncbi:hypothetical protein, conserved [Leishmania tarentolae]|uniref:Uncharacterized protein n=1 Tax=Leishmania tarentolae TaxID=5689 RepID=A0A640K9W3_LEITA|nr:hypothetical protein, conserved [Leishmania tarentolae]